MLRAWWKAQGCRHVVESNSASVAVPPTHVGIGPLVVLLVVDCTRTMVRLQIAKVRTDALLLDVLRLVLVALPHWLLLRCDAHQLLAFEDEDLLPTLLRQLFFLLHWPGALRRGYRPCS